MEPTIIYGVNSVVEALCSGAKIESITYLVGLRASTRKKIEELAGAKGIRIYRAQRQELDRLASGGNHQGVCALAFQTGIVSLEQLALIERKPRTIVLCLDGIQDPGNLGALARSAWAFGATGMVILKNRAAGITPGAMKASSGALSKLAIAKVNNLGRTLEKLKQHGFWISGAVMSEGQAPWDFDPGNKVALVLGSEGGGLRSGIESRLDFRVNIPMMQNMDSLNVSVAGAVLLYEWLGRVKH